MSTEIHKVGIFWHLKCEIVNGLVFIVSLSSALFRGIDIIAHRNFSVYMNMIVDCFIKQISFLKLLIQNYPNLTS